MQRDDVLRVVCKRGEKSEAGDLGFEPRLKESESFVLPLHQSPEAAVFQAVFAIHGGES